MTPQESYALHSYERERQEAAEDPGTPTDEERYGERWARVTCIVPLGFHADDDSALDAARKPYLWDTEDIYVCDYEIESREFDEPEGDD